MSLLSRVLGGRHRPRVAVLGLDGVPWSFLRSRFEQGRLPNLRSLSEGWFSRMTSVQPTVSSVAWATYMTGKNPGKHGIFGFVERRDGSYDLRVPTGNDLVGPALWDVAGEAGLKVIVVNVPMTYPPRPVNGVVVGDFLCTNIDKVAWPPEVSAMLKGMGYRIDADAKTARRSLVDFMADVDTTLERRFAATFRLMDERPWDFLQLHVMETDRVNHFLMPAGAGDPKAARYEAFYDTLDRFVGEFVRRLPADARLVVLSDHGFCPLKREVYLNQFLADRGVLSVPPGEGLTAILPESRAYSLIPGRIYVNVRGREPRGSVDPADYERVREDVSRELADLTDPEDGSRVIREVRRGEDLYRGEGFPPLPAGMDGRGPYPPDLVAVPVDGYDLKGNLGKGVFGRTELAGMHTWDDAFLMVPGARAAGEAAPNIVDVMPTVLGMLSLPVPPGTDGRSLGL